MLITFKNNQEPIIIENNFKSVEKHSLNYAESLIKCLIASLKETTRTFIEQSMKIYELMQI